MTKQFTELTDSQWDAISAFLPTKRKRKYSIRQIVNAQLFILRTGIQWRNLPQTWPKWQTVYYYFDQWKKDETFTKISLELTRKDRKREGREEEPSILSIDSQSVKLNPMICETRGLDGHKLVNGRKRQLLVDSGGRLWAAHVHAANEHDGTAAIGLLDEIVLDGVGYVGERLKKIYGDTAYNGVFANELRQWEIAFEKAVRPESTRGFVPVAKRWVVERTIAWTNFFRRLVKDYEYTISSSVAWLYLGNIQVMLQRIPEPKAS